MVTKLFIFLSLVFCLVAKPLEFQSSEKRTHLVELFSSEGCSSCPPAEEWLTALRKDPGLWKQYVPIEYHVDYWNRLGWLDPFSKAIFTGRQRKYAAQWGSSNVYTPGFVLNGEEWSLEGLANRRIPKLSGDAVGILTVTEIKKHSYKIVFKPKTVSGNLMANGTLLGNGLVSKITHGENGGKTLTHEFVAINPVFVAMDKVKDTYVASLDLTPSLKTPPKSLSIAVWITDSKSLRPIQVLGGDLP